MDQQLKDGLQRKHHLLRFGPLAGRKKPNYAIGGWIVNGHFHDAQLSPLFQQPRHLTRVYVKLLRDLLARQVVFVKQTRYFHYFVKAWSALRTPHIGMFAVFGAAQDAKTILALTGEIGLLHPGSLPLFPEKITKKIRKERLLMASLSQVTPEAGATVTATVPVSANGNGGFQEVWKVNGPFEEAWMFAFNAEVWGCSETYRNDATGYSYDD